MLVFSTCLIARLLSLQKRQTFTRRFNILRTKQQKHGQKAKQMDKVLIFIGVQMPQEEASKMARAIEQKLGEQYYVLIYRRKEPKFEVFYSKDVTHISLDDLVEKLKQTIAQ